MNLLERAREFNRRINQLSTYNSGEIIKKAISDELTAEQIYSYSDLIPDWTMSGYEVDDMRKHKGIIYRCIQAHTSTGDVNHTPDVTPALWVVVQIEREDGGVLDWVVGERVKVGSLRTFNSKTYKCIQEHTTQSGWTPPSVPALWEVYNASEEEIEPTEPDEPSQPTYPEWKQPTSENPYKIGDIVMFNGKLYKSKINGNVWSPTGYAAGWELIA